MLSHELRTPLTPVLVAVQTLTRRSDLPPKVLEVLAMIRRNVHIEAHFIDDLLDLTRITRGKIVIVRDQLDIHDVLRHAIEISAPDLEAKQQRVVTTLEARERRIMGDPTRLPQVFWNLLKNASKFSPNAGEIRVHTTNEPGFVTIAISDTGIGLDPDVMAKIFDPFEQADPPSHPASPAGLGLGLAIAKATVEAHGGTIQARSAGVDQGATFTVTLPFLNPR